MENIPQFKTCILFCPHKTFRIKLVQNKNSHTPRDGNGSHGPWHGVDRPFHQEPDFLINHMVLFTFISFTSIVQHSLLFYFTRHAYPSCWRNARNAVLKMSIKKLKFSRNLRKDWFEVRPHVKKIRKATILLWLLLLEKSGSRLWLTI